MEYEGIKIRLKIALESTTWTLLMLLQLWKTTALLRWKTKTPEEERFITVGMDALGRLLVVIYA